MGKRRSHKRALSRITHFFQALGHGFVSVVKNLFILFVALGFFGVGAFLLWAATLPVPDFSSLDYRKEVESTKIYDRTGEVLLYDIHEEVRQSKVSFEDISVHIKNATVAIEDSDFYSHIGIRPVAFIRAILANLSEGEFSQGGSTITQQVVKNTLLTPEKLISRKFKEWVLALKLEQALSKEEILLLYLNEAPFGGNLYGVEEASQSFFDKHAADVTLAEAAYLAALPQAPTFYSPYGNNIEALNERKNLVLRRMLDLDFIDREAYEQALEDEVVFLPRASHGIKAPHFVTWVREALVELYGERGVQERGLRVITTLDFDMQREAEEIVARWGEDNSVKYNAHNAGMLGMDPKTGDVLVMVGSRDYFNTDNQGNFNVTLSHRQPGSAFKPFVYAAAFQEGYAPETVVFDVQTQFQTTCDAFGVPLKPSTDESECYTPRNYDNVYRGPVTLREALAQSINVPAIKALYLVGIKDALKMAANLGITSLSNADQYGLTLVLGGGEVSLLEMVNAYGVFANEGRRVPYRNILRIEDSNGKLLRSFSPPQDQVLDREIALQVSDVLSDNVARTPAFGSASYLHFPGRDVAVKTGTTNDYRDAWIIGYSPSFVLGSWVGNNDNTSMEKRVAGFIVAPMWNEMMNRVLASSSVETFREPKPATTASTKPIIRGVWQGGRVYEIDSVSGKLATPDTPPEYRKKIYNMDIHSILHWVQKGDPLGPQPTNPANDPQYTLWETPVRVWAEKMGYTANNTTPAPTDYDNVHTSDTAPQIVLTSPQDGSIHPKNAVIPITFTSNGAYGISRVDYHVNGVFVGSSRKAPYLFSLTNDLLPETTEPITIRVTVQDVVGNSGSASATFSRTLE